jgi:methylenetetrahydrofolate--tRNA-(uracil-5-)-methyltransferase
MRFSDQARVFRMIPGLGEAEFLRFGQMHRNTYINSPAVLQPTLQSKADPRILFAGQISGVEGYAESIATGLIAGRNAAKIAHGQEAEIFPRQTALGSLTYYVTHADAAGFQPANITFDLLPALDDETKQRFRHDKQARHAEVCRRAVETMDAFSGALAIS